MRNLDQSFRRVKNTYSPREFHIKEEGYSQQINIVVVGNRNVGKTSLVFKYTCGSYCDVYMPTVGLDRKSVVVNTHDGSKIHVTLWDTSGDIKSREIIARDLYGRAAGFLVLYDVTNIQSYNDVFYWMDTIEKHALENCHVVIIGNKTDLRASKENSDNIISKKEGAYVASCYDVKFMEMSVHNNRNLKKTMKRLVTNICTKKE